MNDNKSNGTNKLQQIIEQMINRNYDRKINITIEQIIHIATVRIKPDQAIDKFYDRRIHTIQQFIQYNRLNE